jgi:hypothetical protein
MVPVSPAGGFGCPCHGGQYDSEGNRTAGPPVRALDRYAYEIREGRIYLVGKFSVDGVDGTGADATMGKYRLAAPGIHIDGVSQILYPIILVTFGFVFVQAFRGKLAWVVALPFAINLVANLAFTPIEFRMRNLPLASVDIVIVWSTIIWSAVAVWVFARRGTTIARGR